MFLKNNDIKPLEGAKHNEIIKALTNANQNKQPYRPFSAGLFYCIDNVLLLIILSDE